VSDVTAPPHDGRADLDRAAADLADRLPDALAPFARLAYNYRWSWAPGGADLFAALDAERFAMCGQNPVRLLGELSSRTLADRARDEGLLARAAELESVVDADLARARCGAGDPGPPCRIPVLGVRGSRVAAGLLRRSRRAGR
jgi:hypothetical protein